MQQLKQKGPESVNGDEALDWTRRRAMPSGRGPSDTVPKTPLSLWLPWLAFFAHLRRRACYHSSGALLYTILVECVWVSLPLQTTTLRRFCALRRALLPWQILSVTQLEEGVVEPPPSLDLQLRGMTFLEEERLWARISL